VDTLGVEGEAVVVQDAEIRQFARLQWDFQVRLMPIPGRAVGREGVRTAAADPPNVPRTIATFGSCDVLKLA